MTISINSKFAFELDEPTDVLLQFEAAAISEQRLSHASSEISPTKHFTRVTAQDEIGERIWINAKGLVEIEYRAQVEIDRTVNQLDELPRMEAHQLPGRTVKYLFASRYCAAERFQSFVEGEFGDCDGGKRINAFRAWISDNFSYEPGSSNPATTALDSLIERRGICRDYAHVLISLARASAIPARYVACYAPGVQPPDFHAVAEVFLADPANPADGAWHLVDPTGMADPAETVIIGVGRDAADVSFMTTFGVSRFIGSKVSVHST